ncbi:MAG: HlyD family efflux transporter periplasmic adaptor subunit [Oscillochloris sp.]|nr:HlyD family efflux transporter periplasmic adaptor subunit [Oscillochloris sp.]
MKISIIATSDAIHKLPDNGRERNRSTMKRIAVLSILLASAILTACSKNTPVTESTPVSTSAAASPTTESAMGNIGGFSSMGGEPTSSTTSTPKVTYTVQKGTIEDILDFNAQVAPVEYPMAFDQDGVIKAISVQPGQSVKKGDPIVQLDMEDLLAQLTQAKLATDQAQSSITKATKLGELEIKKAELDLETAQQALDQAKAPPTSITIAQAQSNVRAAQANLDTTRNNASQAKNKAKSDMDNAVSQLQAIQVNYSKAVGQLQTAQGTDAKDLQQKVDDLIKQLHDAEAAVNAAVINYDTARNNEIALVNDAEARLDLAKAQLNDLLDGPDPYVVAEKERAVRSAEIALEQARQNNQSDPALISAIETGRLQTKQIEEAIAARKLYAPIDGDIATIEVSVGDPIQSGTTVVTLIDRSRLELVATSSEMLSDGRSELPTLTVGKEVEISFSRYPNKTFKGTVSLTPAANVDSPNGNGSYHFFFDAQGLDLTPGDIATIKILLSRKYDTLYLPPKAIRTVRGQSSVMLRTGESESRVEVLIGLSTPDKVEILSGVKEGDIIVGE